MYTTKIKSYKVSDFCLLIPILGVTQKSCSVLGFPCYRNHIRNYILKNDCDHEIIGFCSHISLKVYNKNINLYFTKPNINGS